MSAQSAIPIEGFDCIRRNLFGAREIFEAGELGNFQTWWMTENFVLGAMGGDAAFGEHEEIRGDAISLFHIVGDEKRGAAESGQRVDQLALDLAAQMRVESGKRLVEQQGLRFDGEGARESDALLFAAGEFARRTVLEAHEMGLRDSPFHARVAFGGGQAMEAEGNIFGDGQVREERVMLKKQADATFAAGNVDAVRGIEKRAAVERDASAVWALEARDATERHALSRAGGAENRERIRAAGKFHIQIVSRETLFELDFESHVSARIRLPFSIAGARDFADASSNTCPRSWRGK